MESYLSTDDYTVQPYSSLDGEVEAMAPDWLQDLDDPSRDRIPEAVDRVYTVLEEAVDDHPVERHIDVVVGETDEPFIRDTMGGATGGAFEDAFILCYAPETSGWEDELETATAHEYAHIRYIEQAQEHGQGDGTYRKWQQLLLEAHGMHVADEMTDSDPPWRDAVPDSYLQDREEDIQEELSRETCWGDSEADGMPFFGGGGDWERWTGYTLAWRLGEQLSEDREIDDLPAMTYDETVDAVDELLSDRM